MGVTKRVIRDGHGPKPRAGERVTIHFTGYGRNGDLQQKFYSTQDQGQLPVSFIIGEGREGVPKGWDEGVLQMKRGETAMLECTPDYAFDADRIREWGIEPNSHVNFEVELVEIQGA